MCEDEGERRRRVHDRFKLSCRLVGKRNVIASAHVAEMPPVFRGQTRKHARSPLAIERLETSATVSNFFNLSRIGPTDPP